MARNSDAPPFRARDAGFQHLIERHWRGTQSGLDARDQSLLFLQPFQLPNTQTEKERQRRNQAKRGHEQWPEAQHSRVKAPQQSSSKARIRESYRTMRPSSARCLNCSAIIPAFRGRRKPKDRIITAGPQIAPWTQYGG